MKDFVLKELVTQNIELELEKIGFDIAYRFQASNKYQYKTFKIFDLTIPQASILKQTALSFGADCAVHKEVLTNKVETTNAILGGSISQLKKICDKLEHQPFSLDILANKIKESFDVCKNNTKLVGILNITPDSFSDGGKYFETKSACEHIYKLIDDGADIIDIGAESTKPYSEEISAEEQINRLKPILYFIQNENIKTPISVDTRNAEVALFALENGVKIINDVSGFNFDNKMPEIIAHYNATVVIQHSVKTPKEMQKSPQYNDVVEEVYLSLKNRIETAQAKGIKKIIIDPGIGFGKTREHNIEILDRINEFKSLRLPIMVGLSRKSFLGVNQDDNGLKDSLSLAYSYPLIKSGIDYLRVHNVKLHKQLLNSVI